MACPYCHNPHLIAPGAEQEVIPLSEITGFLTKRKGLLDAVCLSGGEPTLFAGLAEHLQLFRKLGFKTKLDTNGTRPDVLACILKKELVDYVAMDIKAPPTRYKEITGWEDHARIQESARILIGKAPAYEFRTTVFPGLSAGDIQTIASWLAALGGTRYVLQQYRPDRTLRKIEEPPYASEALEEMRVRAGECVASVSVRGL